MSPIAAGVIYAVMVLVALSGPVAAWARRGIASRRARRQ